MPCRWTILKNRASAYEQSVVARMKRLCRDAGLDGDLLGIHPHNAMVSFHYGKPWPNVDYKIVRKILWMMDNKQWSAHHVLDRLYDRYCQENRSHELFDN